MAPTSVAENLMMMALALLDRSGQPVAACHLQSALDALRGKQPMQEGDELTSEQLATLDQLSGSKAA